MVYRYVGYGKRFSLQKTRDFKDFWTMCSTKLAEYYVTSASLEKVM